MKCWFFFIFKFYFEKLYRVFKRSFEFDCDTYGCLNSGESFQMFSVYDFYSEIICVYKFRLGIH